MIKCNAWTLALVGAGLVSLPSVSQAEEKPNVLLTSLASTTISGYVDTSAQWNFGTGPLVPSYAFSSGKADGFNLNVVKLTIEKPVDAQDVWGAGYKADLLFGPDANALFTQSSMTTGDFAVKQAYVSLHTPVGNGLDFKLGVWDTIIGYEVFESANNPNYTRSYGYSMEPTTHTGLLMSYVFSECLSANVGVANTFGPTINGRAFPPQGNQAESYKTYMGSITLTAPKDWGVLAGSTLTGCIINGFDNAVNSGVGANQTSYYVGASLATPVTGLKLGFSYDYLGVAQQNDIGADSSYANAVGGYLSYQATEKLSLYARGEYATSDTFIAPGVNIIGAHRVVEATLTAQYDLWKNVVSRLEFRWDRAVDGAKPYGGVNTGETDNLGTRQNSFILLANVVYKF